MISVCIPTYNRANLLSELLESIAAQNATASDLEVIVSDDASSDHTLKMLASFRGRLPNLRIIEQAVNIGFDRNTLAVVAAARGEYVWLLGDDDRLELNAVHLVKDILSQYPNVAGVTLGSIDYDNLLLHKTGFKQLPPTGLMYSADEVFGKIGDLLGFMSTLVIHRETWNAVCENEPVQDFFRLYVQVYIIGKVLQRKPLWLVFNEPCVHYRSDNDQFIQKMGWFDRLAADVNGYRAISLELFGRRTRSAKLFESKIFNAHVRARLINGQTSGMIASNRIKVTQLLLKNYYSIPTLWLLVLPMICIPKAAIAPLRRFYQKNIPFSGTRRAEALNKK